MCSVQYLRDFIKERLTAACEEIFSEVQKTIVHYEEEISRQRRLLDISRKPDTHSHITDIPQHHVYEEEEGLTEEQVCTQERNSSLDQEDPELPQIKEEHKELCSSQEGEELGLQQEAEGILTDKEQLRLLETMWKPEIKLHRIDLQQKHVCEEEVFIEQQICDQERNSSLDQEDPQPLQIKEEQEELLGSQKGEQLGLKEEVDTFMVTPTYERHDYHEPQPNSEQFLYHTAPDSESRDEDESQHVDPGSTRNAELKKRTHRRKRSHSQRRENIPVSESQSQTDTRKTFVQCDTCGKMFKNKSKLTTHLQVHIGEKPHSCSTHGKGFIQKSDLDRHIRTHTGEKLYPCSTCEKRFTDSSSFIRHMRLHTGEKPYPCSTCKKRFNQKSDLEYHVRTHTGEKPHSCSTCGKGFIQKSDLDRHIRTHTGEKPHSCSTCGKRFIQKSAMRTHIRTHTGEKPYPCSTCGERFIQRANLKSHMRIHTGLKSHA